MQVHDTEVIGVLLQTELIPLCLRTMEMGSELSTLLSWLCFFLLVMHCSLASFFAFLMSFAYAAASASDGMCFLLLGIILVCVCVFWR